jgi:hypothetical protein
LQTNAGRRARKEVKDVEEAKEVEDKDEHGKSERIFEEFGGGFGGGIWAGTRGDYGW